MVYNCRYGLDIAILDLQVPWRFRMSIVPELGITVARYQKAAADVATSIIPIMLVRFSEYATIVSHSHFRDNTKSMLLSGIRFYFLGFWSPIILPLSPKSIYFIPRGYSTA